jgi:SAM-dependent methyltransferase
MTEVASIIDYERSNVKDVYEIIAHQFSVTRLLTWSWIDNFIYSINKNSLIYDIGCGNGRNMGYEDYKFIGIDNCDNFINICREKNYNVINSNMMNINLPDNSADAIISVASFHHLSNHKNRLKALIEMHRLIKQNGRILISVWSINQPDKTRIKFNKYGDTIVKWKKKYDRYYYIFQIEEIVQLFKLANLHVMDHKYDCGNEIFILTKY